MSEKIKRPFLISLLLWPFEAIGSILKYLFLGIYYSLLYPFVFIFMNINRLLFGVYDKNRKKEAFINFLQ